MAIYQITAPDGHTYQITSPDTATQDEVLAYAKANYQSAESSLPADVVNEPGLQEGGDVRGLAQAAGGLVKAGAAGVTDLETGQGLQQAATDVSKVEQGQSPTSLPGKVGEFIGSFFTPEQILLQFGTGAFLGATGIGTWVSNLLAGWGKEAALSTVGKVKTLAKALGLTNLDALCNFILKPVTIAGKSFGPILTATSTPADMLETANAIKTAAGKELGNVADQVDNVISKDTGALDWAGLQNKVAVLKQEAVGDIENLGSKVADQYDDAIADLDNYITKQLQGQTDTAFSDLSAIKTKIGNLVYKHGSPLESKAALEDVYHAINEVLEDAAKGTSDNTGAAYSEMNQIYHQAVSVTEGLQGKVVDAMQWFSGGAISAALGTATGMITHNPIAAVAVPVAYMGTKMLANYGPQAIAAGLNAAAPIAGPIINGVVRAGTAAIPPVVQALTGQ